MNATEKLLFEFLATGVWLPETIETVITAPGATLTRSTESEASLETCWQKLLACGFKPWPNDLKPMCYRFAGFSAKADGGLSVTLDPCLSYRDVISSRDPDFWEHFPEEFHPRPLSVTTAITALDRNGREHLLITLRDNTQDVKPGGFHVSTAGSARIGTDETPTAAALREAQEECGARLEEIATLRLRAVVFAPWTQHVELIHCARLSVSCEEILARKPEAKEDTVRFIPKTRNLIEKLLVGALHAAVPVGAAALLLTGEDMTDAAWRRYMEACIQAAGACYSRLPPKWKKIADELSIQTMKALIG